ncbi:MAG: pyridoxine 5'-phosphate synthase [Planctomycetes bacterium]|nr:pyridoxine 5'-phosphate synthase [Planctomycetota bacterium]
MPRLHVNIDHVATLRQARRETFPDPITWALAAEKAGAQGITCHLRTDQRHIQPDDVKRLRRALTTRLNLELSLEPGVVDFALRIRPQSACIVPEKRAEVTTEGGLDVVRERKRLLRVVPLLAAKGAEVSLFIDPDPRQVEAAFEVGAHFVELHTGTYANALGKKRERELERLRDAAALAITAGLRVNAGHGLDYENVAPIAAIPRVEELNIGFAIVAESLFSGVREAVTRMQRLVRRGSRAASSASGGR